MMFSLVPRFVLEPRVESNLFNLLCVEFAGDGISSVEGVFVTSAVHGSVGPDDCVSGNGRNVDINLGKARLSTAFFWDSREVGEDGGRALWLVSIVVKVVVMRLVLLAVSIAGDLEGF